jgi:uncharacterized protein YjdB
MVVLKNTLPITQCLEMVYPRVSGIKINPSSANIIVDSTKQLSVVFTPLNAVNKNITWSSVNNSVAAVDTNGLVSAFSIGQTAIVVTTEDGNYKDTCFVNVTAAPVHVTGIDVTPATAEVIIGNTQQLNATIAPVDATNQNFSWQSANDEIATVNSNGLVTAVSVGTVAIFATTEDGNKADTCIITVLPISVTGISILPESIQLNSGNSQQLTATITPTDAANKNIFWSSVDESVAIVSSTGLVTAVSDGNTTIIGTTEDGGFIDSCVVTVVIPVSSVSVTPEEINIAIDATQQLTATILPIDATNKNISWSSDNSAIASVDQNGLVTGVSIGSTVVSVTTEDGDKTDDCVVNVATSAVNELTNLNIELYPNPAVKTIFFNNLPAGSVIKLLDVNGQVLYSSDKTDKIDIENYCAGTYYVEVIKDNNRAVYKLIKK